jgi:hypothetical protein
MDDLTKESQAGHKAAGEPDGWSVPDIEATEIGPWIAFMRGEDLQSRRTAAQAKKPWVFVGLRKKGRIQQFSSP